MYIGFLRSYKQLYTRTQAQGKNKELKSKEYDQLIMLFILVRCAQRRQRSLDPKLMAQLLHKYIFKICDIQGQLRKTVELLSVEEIIIHLFM